MKRYVLKQAAAPLKSSADRACGKCDWFADALLDGDPSKGVCNYGSAQRRGFVRSPDDRVRIVHRNDPACTDFKGPGFHG